MGIRCFPAQVDKLKNGATLAMTSSSTLLPLVATYVQLPVATLVEHALQNAEGLLADNGSLVVETGAYTGRSPNDRFVVDTPGVHDVVEWGNVNRPMAPDVFDRIYDQVVTYLGGKKLYQFDGFSGADKRYSLSVRFLNELASHNLFVHQMFIRPSAKELATFSPDWTVMSAPGLALNPADYGLHSEAAILVNFEKKVVLVVATRYAGEMKKSIFSVMNCIMPDRDVFPMHCSANVGKDGRSALFFGLSGTGKTTLSADPDRFLIGDDEHGWSPDGIFNFEGGCYAKAIRLSKANEPEIYNAIRFGSLSENVVTDPDTRRMDFDDARLTENSRVAYPVEFIPNADLTGMAPHPDVVIFLTCDAFGVFPAISKLTVEQAQYHFISGYTSKVAGTERGITEPTAAFSTCYGAPFMPRPSAVYAAMLKRRMEQHQADVYLVNTGWQGGAYGVGQRISIPHTRALITAAMTGGLKSVAYTRHALLNVMVPKSCPGVDAAMLDPQSQWADKTAYEATARKLAGMFVDNFKHFQGVDHLVAAGPIV
jgi:phosphoenolpyruvate carboxykinase (ATP)